MSDNKDIRLDIQFKFEERLPAGFFARFIQIAEQAIYESELEDLFEVSVSYPEISKVELDAVRYRMDHNWGRSLQIEDAYAGSIIISGLVSGLAYWILDKTLGDTLREVWHGSVMQERVKGFLLGEPLKKSQQIAAKIDAKLNEDLYIRQYETKIEYEIEEDDPLTVTFVVELLQDILTPPTRGDAG